MAVKVHSATWPAWKVNRARAIPRGELGQNYSRLGRFLELT